MNCSTHTNDLAAWTCAECSRGLCEECAAPDWVGKLKVARCTHCGAISDLVTYRQEIPPVMVAVQSFFRALRHGEQLIQLLALSVIMLLCWFGILLRDLFQAVLLLSYMLTVVRSASRGHISLPEPSAEQLGGTFSALLRLMVASWSLWAPLLLVYTFAGDSGRLFTITLLAALVLIPVAVLLTALGYSLVLLFNPLTLVRTISTVGFRYWQAALVFCLCILGVVFISANIGTWLTYQPIPFVGDVIMIVLAHTVQVGILACGAFAVGWVAFESGDRLALWTELDLIRAQVPDAVPKASAVKRREDRIEDERSVDLELTQNDPLPVMSPESQGASMHASVESYEISDLPLDEDNIDLSLSGMDVSLSESVPETLSEALVGDDAVRIGDLYESILRASGSPPALTPAEYLKLGDILSKVGRYQAAANVYRKLAQTHASASLAPEAIYRLAYLMSDRLQRTDMATTLLTLLAEKYPDFEPMSERDPSALGAKTEAP